MADSGVSQEWEVQDHPTWGMGKRMVIWGTPIFKKPRKEVLRLKAGFALWVRSACLVLDPQAHAFEVRYPNHPE